MRTTKARTRVRVDYIQAKGRKIVCVKGCYAGQFIAADAVIDPKRMRCHICGSKFRYVEKKGAKSMSEDFHCQVPGCKGAVMCGWKDLSSGKQLRTCRKHFRMNNDPENEFDFYKLLGITKPVKRSKQMSATKTKTTNKVTIADKVATVMGKSKKDMTQRQTFEAINKGKKTKDQVSIYGVRAAVAKMMESGVLTLTENGPRDQYILHLNKKKLAQLQK